MQRSIEKEREGEGNMMGIILREIREAREEARKDKEELKGGIKEIRREMEEIKRDRKTLEEK